METRPCDGYYRLPVTMGTCGHSWSGHTSLTWWFGGLFDGSRTLRNSCKLQTLYLASRLTEIPHTQGGQTLPRDVRVEDGGSFYRVVPLPTHTAQLLVHSPPLLAMSEEAVQPAHTEFHLEPLCAPGHRPYLGEQSLGAGLPTEGPFPIRHKQRKGCSRDLGAGRGGSKLFLPRRDHTLWYQGRHLSLEVLLEKLMDRGRDGHGSTPRAHLWRTPLPQRAGVGGGSWPGAHQAWGPQGSRLPLLL